MQAFHNHDCEIMLNHTSEYLKQNTVFYVVKRPYFEIDESVLQADRTVASVSIYVPADKPTEHYTMFINEKLDALNPLSVLSRGYSVVTKDGVSVKSGDVLSSGDKVSIRFADGCANAVIE